MPVVLLVARLLLAAVFAVAALTKLADLAGSRQAMRNFGVPERLAVPLGTLLPIAELAIAITLRPRGLGPVDCSRALLLLLLFVAGIAYNLARGRTPDCHCFGQLHEARPAGRRWHATRPWRQSPHWLCGRAQVIPVRARWPG